MNQIDQLENTMNRVLHWIETADSKTAPVLAIVTAMLGTIAALAPKYDVLEPSLVWHGVVTIIPLFLSIGGLVIVTFPRTHCPHESMIFFGGIASRNKDDFCTLSINFDREKYLSDLATQCYQNSIIARSKYRALRFAMGSLFVSVIPWLILIWRLYKL